MSRVFVGATVLVVLTLLLVRILFPGTFPALFAPLFSLGDALHARVHTNTDDAVLRELQNENEALKARLRDVGAATTIPSETGILAGVLSRPPMSPYDTLLVKTNGEQVPVGAIVFGEAIPIGFVSESSGTILRVLLYSTPGQETHGWVGEARLPLSLLGKGSGAYFAELPREAEVAEGDTVYLPGPGAFPAGTVRKIEQSASSPSKTLLIEPSVNLFSLSFVRILP